MKNSIIGFLFSVLALFANFAFAVDPDFSGITTAATTILALVSTSLIAVMAVKVVPVAVKWALGKIASMLGR